MPSLEESDCWALVAAARHGVLSTVHPDRGVDAVPVVYAVVDRVVVVPVDTVKPKRHLALGRLGNLTRDPRCVLLVEHYADDWSALWWVRIHAAGSWEEPPPGLGPNWLDALAARYPQYRAPGTVAAAIVLRPTAVMGWAARRAGRNSGSGGDGSSGGRPGTPPR